MPLKSLGTIKSRALQRVHLTTAQISLTNSATDGDTILGEIVNERASIIQGTADFSWARKTWELISAASKTGVANPVFYPLPLDFKHELSVVETSQTYPLSPMSWEEYKILEPIVLAVGKPYRYIFAPGGANICFYPSPSTGVTIAISYATKPFTLLTDACYPNVPPRVEDEYFRCLLEGVVMDLYAGMPNQDERRIEAKSWYDIALRDLKTASKLNGLLVPVLAPMDIGASGLPRAQLPTEYPIGRRY